MTDYYRALEVDPQASPEVIEKAFKALSIKYHPDTNKNMDSKQASKKWMELREAYSILSNPDKRQEYDAKRKKILFGVFLEEGLIGLALRLLR